MQPSKKNQASRKKLRHVLLATSLLAGGQLLHSVPTFGASPTPGTVIQNQATGSFVDTSDNSNKVVESNIVQVTVTEVAGITITSINTPTATNGSIANFDFSIANVGNDPTKFFLPKDPSSVVGGTAGTMQVVGYIPAGGSQVTLATPINIAAAGNTGALSDPTLGGNTTLGSVPAGAAIVVRVPVTVTAASGSPVTVTLGNTTGQPSANNTPYVLGANGTGSGDLYTVDNANGAVTGEAAGMPINGDALNHYQEASATQTVNATGAPPICVLPASMFNSSNYSLNTPLQNSFPLTFFGGSMQFNAFLSGTGTWSNGIQVQNGLWANGVNGDYLYLQPQNTPSFTTSGNRANYVLSFPAPVTNFGAVLAGLNDTDGTTITASYRGVPIQITAANFSNLSANMVLVDTNSDGQMDTVVGNNAGGGAAVNINTYDLNIAGPIDNITIFSGKDEPRITTPTIAMYAFQYCYNSSSSLKANVLPIKRITEINGDRTQNPNDTTKRLDGYINGATPNDDPTLNWPSNYLIGSDKAGLIKPGDVIEYTVYFMNASGSYATSVKFCDRILGAQQFLADAYGAGKDIEYKLGTNPVQYLTKESLASVDGGELNPSTSAIAGCPAPSITGTNNGTVVLDVTGNTGTGQVNITALPGATAPGTPNNSYGYFRFKVKVDP